MNPTLLLIASLCVVILGALLLRVWAYLVRIDAETVAIGRFDGIHFEAATHVSGHTEPAQ